MGEHFDTADQLAARPGSCARGGTSPNGLGSYVALERSSRLLMSLAFKASDWN